MLRVLYLSLFFSRSVKTIELIFERKTHYLVDYYILHLWLYMAQQDHFNYNVPAMRSFAFLVCLSFCAVHFIRMKSQR